MPAGDQLAAQADDRKGVPGISEGPEQEPAARLRQSISASSRTIVLRSSGSKATGVTISVPTPASR